MSSFLTVYAGIFDKKKLRKKCPNNLCNFHLNEIKTFQWYIILYHQDGALETSLWEEVNATDFVNDQYAIKNTKEQSRVSNPEPLSHWDSNTIIRLRYAPAGELVVDKARDLWWQG